MFNGKLSNSIINHPFVFLAIIALIASSCLGGIFFISWKGRNASIQKIPTTTTSATDQNIGIAGSTRNFAPTNEKSVTVLPESSGTVVKPSALEPTVISRPIAPSETITEIPVLGAMATSMPFAPFETATLVPMNAGGALVVTFIDVGQGDSILIEAPNGHTMLIDGGSAGNGALAYLQKQGIKSIDLMIATHPHEDHIGGLVEVLNTIPVKKVITNGQSNTTSIYEHFLDAITNAKAEYIDVARGDTINLGSITFSVLSPAAIIGDDMNHNSLVLRMNYGTTTFLFMGDADMDAESGILAASLPVKADILKLGHHGSCQSSSPALLDAVHPVVAIYSAGLHNPYGHPCVDTINALKARSVFVFGTDTTGSIIITVTMEGYTITNSTGVIFRR
jgi:competence protein ComEC